MSTFQTVLFAIIQGITELFPISSVAHGVLTPFFFGWDLGPEFLKEHFLPFVVMLHLGTALALLIFFWRDWVAFIAGVFDGSAVGERRTLALLVVATVPAAVLGVVFQSLLTSIFSSVSSAAAFLVVNGVLLYTGERLQGTGTRTIKELSFKEAAIIGCAQALALIPGFSRSGAAMVAGFWMGLRHEAAARFSMLLAAPIILGAGIVAVPKMLHSASSEIIRSALLGGVLSGVCAFFAVWVLMAWFKKHEINAMRPFAIYCVVVGIAVLVWANIS
ncbi:MAG TPA: undecaprenyl-diphosphate phosphatase [Stellaceae bacterium]|nr:undecaprenyl-diphosphate phosphatase [Stellaceae bacterium]